MYVVKFQGALGNQMFERALMCRLQKEYPDTPVKAYIPKIADFNGYELDKVFGINLSKVTWQMAMRLGDDVPEEAPDYEKRVQLMNVKKDYFGYKSSHIKQAEYTSFYPEVLKLGALNPYYLDGVWANAKYLEGMRDILLEEFTFANPLDDKNQEVVKQMDNQNSVAVHLRRNEYVTNNLSVVCDQYYRNAILYMKEKLIDPVFYVFSDDLEYCRNLFSGIDHVLVSWNRGEDSYKDMQLMSHCKHNIIANSTFSFWGAYLGKNTDKIVIAPNISYGNCKYPFACENWIKMDAK